MDKEEVWQEDRHPGDHQDKYPRQFGGNEDTRDYRRIWRSKARLQLRQLHSRIFKQSSLGVGDQDLQVPAWTEGIEQLSVYSRGSRVGKDPLVTCRHEQL